ncbi:hypothetical protein DYB25_004111 [Aphanomyces astaci]|uniref:Uncharacterized protein n=1 Tax=Aphanomyces astaci TaxID=112090 RepID=A0A397B2C9_APHAT|nr:hypothetical protein DYB25_004111 [Aphanomyces astaci]
MELVWSEGNTKRVPLNDAVTHLKAARASSGKSVRSLLQGSSVQVEPEANAKRAKYLETRRQYLQRIQEEKEYNKMLGKLSKPKRDSEMQKEMKSVTQHVSIGVNMIAAMATAFFVAYYISRSVTESETTVCMDTTLSEPMHPHRCNIHPHAYSVDNPRLKRVRRPTSSPFTLVILSSELMGTVGSYQRGIVVDMLPFLAFDPKRLQKDKALTDKMLTVDGVHKVLSTWLTTFGFDRLRLLFDRLGYMRFLVASDAVYFGNYPLLDALHTSFTLSSFRGNFLDLAALANDLEMVRYLHERGHNGCTTAAMDAAAKCGNVNMVEYLDTHRSEGCTAHGLALATIHGHTAVARYLQDKGLAKYEKNWLMAALQRMRTRQN